MFNVIKDNLQILNEAEVCAMSTASYYKSLLNPQHLYDIGITGKDTVCAVIDSGCDFKHPAFKDKIIGGRNFIKEGKGPEDFSDLNGHGTHVAGLIASHPYLSFNGGIAPDAKLLICKALGENGSGSFDAIINSINYAVDQKVDVINMSLGGGVDVPELHTAIKRAVDNNIIGMSSPFIPVASSLILSNFSNRNLSIASELLLANGSRSSLITILSYDLSLCNSLTIALK